MKHARPIVAESACKEQIRVLMSVLRAFILPRSLKGLSNLTVLSADIPELPFASGSIILTISVIAYAVTTMKSRQFQPSLK